ncbi:lysophospholipid acyltransferase 5-like isoform X1 [Halichondria panicea]|uniref:lysophospholipid acyltransferase 5-like isoform X1 n=2 Tax=Halichondria panicea TaxID=6063 RepID=UPI00312B44B9
MRGLVYTHRYMYNGVDKSGSVDWYGLSNIHLLKAETSITLHGIVESFNINTNKWIALYVFKRLRFLGSKTLSLLISLTFVSLWHGVWPGYALCFSLEFMLLFAERSFISFMKWLLGGTLSEFSLPLRALLTLAAFILRNVLLFYPLMLFMLLSWDLCFKFMSSVYFMDHIIVIVWCFLFYTVLANVIRKPKPKKDE